MSIGGPACTLASRRAAQMAAMEKKVFVIHDEGENSTVARSQTAELWKAMDVMGVTTYYRNAPIVLPSTETSNHPDNYSCSWVGQSQRDIDNSTAFIRTTCISKGPFYAAVVLGDSSEIGHALAGMHGLQVEESSPPSPSASYPVIVVTPLAASSYFIPSPSALLDTPILTVISDSIESKKQLCIFPKPTIQELRAMKQAKKQIMGDYALLRERAQQEGLPKSSTAKPVIPSLPVYSKHHDSAPYPYRPTSVPASTPKGAMSNALLAPAAEPVTPCSLDSLDGMIRWLEKNADIAPSQEPRIDFTKGSILGKTTPGGGTSVDLCKQVVGPKGIKPILDAVGKNEWIDRFLLGNNIVGDEGAKVIADFINDEEKSKRIYNFYIAGNSITHVGIKPIANALTHNPHVTALWLKRNDLGPKGALHLAEMLEQNCHLQVLDLVVTNIGDEGAESIFAALTRNPNSALEHLYLGSSGHGVRTAKAAAAYMKTGQSKLKSLFMAMLRLGDEGAEALAEGLKETDCLERIGLSSCLIGDRGAKALADALEGQKNLVSLDLGWRRGTLELGEEGNMIKDEGALFLADKLLPTIRQVDLTNNLISPEGVRQVVEKLNVRILSARLKQRGERDVDAEMRARDICRKNEEAFGMEVGEEADRVREARWPKHVKDIYSIYRGNM